MTDAERRRIFEEINFLDKLDQTHILELITSWSNPDKEEVVLITELMSCSLKDYLKQHTDTLNLAVIKTWAKNILQGLHYMHSLHPPVIHRDLKCENIFISASTGTIKIGDLGYCTELIGSHKQSQVGTAYFMAPEMFAGEYSEGVDIYAFGMCVLEMCTHSTPYSECKSYGALQGKVYAGVRPLAFHRVVDQHIRDFIELCLSPKNQRPNAKELLHHEFLHIVSDPNLYLPIEILPEETKEEEEDNLPFIRRIVSVKAMPSSGDLHDVELIMESSGGSQSKVEFQFNPQEDVPEKIAEELVGQMKLSSQSINLLLQTIEDQITAAIAKQSDSVLNIKLSLALESEGVIQKRLIEIPYDLNSDTPISVAQEIVEVFHLDVSETWDIAGLVNEKVRKAQTKLRK